MTDTALPVVPESQSPARRQRAQAPASQPAQLPVLSGPSVDRANELLDSIPTVEEDPTEQMLAAILAAGSAAEIEKVFTSEKWREHIGEAVRVHAIRVMDSDFTGPFGRYLLCDVTMLDTGERTVMGVGGTLAMGQLLNHWSRGDLPFDFEVIVKEKATRNGFHPMRLRALGKPAGESEQESA